jgi:acyl-CoA hydrolase
MSKPVKESALESTYMVMPGHTNAMGNIFGGTIMSWIDVIAAIVSFRHCRTLVVTAAMDDLHFMHPVKLGDLVTLKASVNFTSKRSLEVGVKVMAENPVTGAQNHTSSAYLTYVSLDAAGQVLPVPAVVPESAEEIRRFEDGRLRREGRLARRVLAKKPSA